MKELILLAIAATVVAIACAQVDFGASNIHDNGWNYSPSPVWTIK